ncbi:MAG TPA: HEAT repeat domain-containing protein [Vicinamibacteria bacterium]|nr:HEAT repeat domain-containing protein [Vicinamibacteria bacterium]
MLELVRALAIAWKNLAAYPPGHPALVASLGQAHRRLQDLFAASDAVAFGVTRDGLICAQEKLTSSHAADLARALYVREVAVLHLEAGLQPADLEELLRAISADGTRGDRPPLADELAGKGIQHVRVETVDFSQVRLVEGTASEAAPLPLWEDLLRVVLAGHALSAEGRRLIDSGEAASARGLASVLGEVLGGGAGAGGGGGAGGGAAAPATGAAGIAPARAAVGGTALSDQASERIRLGARLAQAAGRHLHGTSAERVLAAAEVAELVRALPPDMRETLVAAALKALATEESAAAALEALAGGLAPDTVLQALRRIKNEVPLSSHALRLMHALSAAAPSARARGLEPPDPALLAELSVLFREDDIDRYNPEEHQTLLEKAAIDVPVLVADEEGPDLGERLESVTEDSVGERLASTAVELFFRFAGQEGTETLLARIEVLFRGFVSSGRLDSATTLVEDLREAGRAPAVPPAARAQLEEAMGRMASTESIMTMLDAFTRRGPQAAVVARRLMDALGTAAARGFLLALAEEKDKSRRRRILDLAVSLGSVIALPATELLADPRWYVVRNMIVLLHRVGERSALPGVRRCAEHTDLRVRLEAIKWLLAYDPEVPRDLLERAIHDPDPKVAEAAVALAGNYGIKEAVDPLLAIVDGLDLMGRRRSLRLKALKALGDLAEPSVLPRLERYFRSPLLPLLALEERRAAYRTLAMYAPEARRGYVEKGLRSRDPEIRQVCERLRREQAPEQAGGEA